MVYTNDDSIIARWLEEMDCVAVTLPVAPSARGVGIRNRLDIRTIVENAGVPTLEDAGTASDAAIATEPGCDRVLMNTAIAADREA